MIINESLERIVLTDDISACNKAGNIGNGIIAVDRIPHPALKTGINMMENSQFKNHIYDDEIFRSLNK